MSGSPRESVGKKDAKRHRAEGRVPCVVYGGEEQLHFVAEEKAILKIIQSPDTFFIHLTVGEKKFDCVLKDIQFHPVSDSILHADFIEFKKDKPLTLSIPVKYEGTSPGVIKGGQLTKKFRKLPVRALPVDMPEYVVVDISNLDINQRILISELAQEKFQIMEKPERYIVAIAPTRASAATTEGEGK
jgi:large subunit ribosomal protein L25